MLASISIVRGQQIVHCLHVQWDILYCTASEPELNKVSRSRKKTVIWAITGLISCLVKYNFPSHSLMAF